MRRIKGLYIFALALAGCATDQGGIEVRTVEVPTPVECVPANEIPEEPPTVSDRLTGSAAVDLAIIAESALLLRAWGKEMHAALTACAG